MWLRLTSLHAFVCTVAVQAIDNMEAHSVLTLEGYGSDKEDGWVLLEETPEEAVAGEGVA